MKDFLSQWFRVNQFAIVGHCDPAMRSVHHKRLAIDKHGRAQRGVSVMSDAHIPFKSPDVLFPEHVGHQSHSFVLIYLEAIAGHNARTFLTTIGKNKNVLN